MSDIDSIDFNDMDVGDSDNSEEEEFYIQKGGDDDSDEEVPDSEDDEVDMPDISLDKSDGEGAGEGACEGAGEGDSDDSTSGMDNTQGFDQQDSEEDDIGGSDDYSDDDSDDDEYFKKFDSELRKKHLTTFHPESFSNNYDEISKLTRVVRDDDNIIIDPLHKTAPFLTKYEYTKILGVRAKQLDAGATPFVKVPENMIDSYLIAKLELAEKRIPFIIRRPIANGSSEYWNLKDLEIVVRSI